MAHQLLLADDSVTIQRVIKLTFADEDVDVVTVGDGNQAVAHIDQQPPDIVLADVAMPGRTGYEVAQHIRMTPRLAHIPVLLLTGAFEPIDEAKASEVGCDGILAKPFEPDVVVSRVKELLARPRAAAPALTPALVAAATPAAAPPAMAPAAPAPPFAPSATASVATALASNVVVMPKPASFTVNLPSAPAAAASVVERQPAPAAVEVKPAASAVEGSVVAGKPAPSAVEGAKTSDVDAYFERLDQAFASLALSPRTPPAPAPAAPEPAAAPALSWPFDVPAVPAASPAPVVPAVAAVATAAAVMPAVAPLGSRPAPAISGDAIEAIDSMDAIVLTPAQVDQIADRVVEKLTARLAVNLPDLVANVAERLVRAEIDQIKKRV